MGSQKIKQLVLLITGWGILGFPDLLLFKSELSMRHRQLLKLIWGRERKTASSTKGRGSSPSQIWAVDTSRSFPEQVKRSRSWLEVTGTWDNKMSFTKTAWLSQQLLKKGSGSF